MAQELTAEALRELVTYDAETGRFTWLASRPHCRPGETAGGFDKDGYWCVNLFRRRYVAHRLAWLYVHGEWPTPELDHINMNRSDNRMANLRLGTRRDNIANSGLRSTNKSGFKGVHWCRRKRTWTARIRDNGKHRFLGYFADPMEAGDVYAAAARAIYGDFARLR